MSFYVYAYYEPDCAEPFYIGKGQGRRAWRHLEGTALQMKDPFHNKLRSMIRDGYQPDIQIMEDAMEEQAAFDLEIALIRKFGRRDLGTGCLLNCTDGGDGQSGAIVSEETTIKRKEAWTRGMRKAAASRARSQTTGGRKKRPIIALLNGRLIKRYAGICDVKNDGFNSGNVARALTGVRPSAHGYEWEYAT